jgi:hypothetical protein
MKKWSISSEGNTVNPALRHKSESTEWCSLRLLMSLRLPPRMALLLPQMARLPRRLYLATARPCPSPPADAPSPAGGDGTPSGSGGCCGHRSSLGDVLDLGDGFLLGEGFLCGVKVRGVGRQVDELTALIFDQRPYSLGLVCPEVVHHHELTRSQGGGQDMLHIGFKELPLVVAPTTAIEDPIPCA